MLLCNILSMPGTPSCMSVSMFQLSLVHFPQSFHFFNSAAKENPGSACCVK
ncbi:hypothetical protein HanRHA438_Chr03g0133101 [Helianthus annuus]|nr:hypothetical protein HanRHA438_Chr03g0133101 [Helianthus annuus]